MKDALLAVVMCCAPMLATAAPRLPVPLVNLGDIHGAALGWINLAMPVFKQQVDGDIKAYAISVQQAGDVIHVVFHRTPDVRGQRGAAREGPGLEVEINRTTGVVMSAHVIR